jgi:hypothetical protein
VAQLTLSEWKETSFTLTEDEARKIYSVEDYLPEQIVGAVADLAENINTYILGLYNKVWNFYSEAGFAGAHTNPFTTTKKQEAAVKASGLLGSNMAPPFPRYFVMNQVAEDNALMNDIFVHADYLGQSTVQTGIITDKFGFKFGKDHQMPTHTAGTAAAAADITVSNNTAAGVKTITMAKGSSTATVVVGDLFQFASDTTNTYVATSAVTIPTGGVSVTFEPALKNAVTSTTAVDFTPSHSIAGLAFHSSAFAVAFRPPIETNLTRGRSAEVQIFDPISNIPLRLTVSPEHRQTSWYFDVLYGAAAVRPELAVRIAGAP